MSLRAVRAARRGGDRLGGRRRRRAAQPAARQDRGRPDARTRSGSRRSRARVGTAIDGKKWYVDAGGGDARARARRSSSSLAVVLLWIGVDGWRSASPRWSDVVIVALGGCAVANAALLVVRADAREDVAAPLEGRRDRGRALGGLPPLPDRLPPAAGGAARDARALGALPRLRDRVRDRGARAPGRAPAHAGGAAQPEHDLLDQPDRRPRLGRERARDRRPLVRLRLGALAAELGRRRRASPAAEAAEAAAGAAAPGRSWDGPEACPAA